MSCGPKLLYEWTIAGYIVRIEETGPGIVRFVQGRCDASLPPSIMEFEPTEKPIGTANEIIHLAKALEQQREATKEAWRAAELRAWYDCLDCGTHVKVDEDGCCATCGRDADFIDLDYVQRRMTTMERENEELRSEIAALREAIELGKKVMLKLQAHGPAIVPHLLDNDDNDGERFRQAIRVLEGKP